MDPRVIAKTSCSARCGNSLSLQWSLKIISATLNNVRSGVPNCHFAVDFIVSPQFWAILCQIKPAPNRYLKVPETDLSGIFFFGIVRHLSETQINCSTTYERNEILLF